MSSAKQREQIRRTRSRPIISYAESSSSKSDSEIDAEESESELDIKTRQRPFRTSSRSQKCAPPRKRIIVNRHKSKSIRNQRRRTKRRRTLDTLPKTPATQPTESFLGSGVIPPWQTLPYYIFIRIFQFASYPLYEENTFQPLPSTRWLLRIAQMCRAFSEPAITVLYSSPPLVPMVQAHMLVDLLKMNPKQLAFKYRQKVVSLRIEVSQVATYILRKSGYVDLYGLVRDLPRLLDLEFYHQKDMSPYRDLDVTIKWNYPDSVFEALEFIDPTANIQKGDKTSICKLRSWRWSSRLAGKKWSIEKLVKVHLKPTFACLRRLAFVNYQIPNLRDDEEDPNHEKHLAESLRVLQDLESLTFESSTLVNSKLLPLLPQNLRELQLINCWEVTSEDFADFLITHGQNLHSLTLDHNQSLNLAFLTVLGNACPSLQIFRMNMTYFNIHTSYRDCEPIYDHLLLPDQVPVWPTKLQSIELIQLRKWETKAAEMFFTSLLQSATSLSDLRRLSLQVILNIGWRDRANFRDKWVGLLNQVFKRISSSPLPHHTIHPVTARLDESELKCLSSTQINSGSRLSHSPNSPVNCPVNNYQDEAPRRSRRAMVRAIPHGRYVESSSSNLSESDEVSHKHSTVFQPPTTTKMHARLVRELNILKATGGIELPPLTSSPPGSPFDLNSTICSITAHQNQATPISIHAMCDSVEIRIDNLRPAETQVTEADFLDEEPSGDEDWNSTGE